MNPNTIETIRKRFREGIEWHDKAMSETKKSLAFYQADLDDKQRSRADLQAQWDDFEESLRKR